MIYLVCFFIPVLIWGISIAVLGIFPFGENIIFTSDMAYQYAGYFEYIQNILSGGAEPIFSLYKGLGEETLGMMAYYMMSPFNLILRLFKRENVTEAVLLINLLKVGACGLTFSVFIKNKFKNYNNNFFSVVAFSTCYALMAYNIAYQFNIMWLDGVVWLPIIILGIDRIINRKKSELFYISLSIAIISNWYIGFMLCLFSGVYVLYRLILCEDVNIVKVTLKKFILFGVLAAITAVIVIFPSALTCLSETNRADMESERNMINYTLVDIFSKFVIGGFDFEQIAGTNLSENYLNLPNLFAGTSVLILFILYFFNNSVDKKERILDGVFSGILLAVTLFAPLNRAWHVFSYNIWFPYRYSFCLTFFMIYVAYKSFLQIKNIEQNKIWKVFLVLTGIYLIIEKLNYTYIIPEEIYCTIFMLFAFCIALKLVKGGEKNAYLLLLIVVIAECCANTLVYTKNIGYGNRNKFYEERAKLVEKLNEIPESDRYYRIENNIVSDYNASIGLEYRGITSSTTMGNDSSRGLLEAIGYTRVANNSVKYSPTTRFTDNFLGIKYYITDEIQKNEDALSVGFSVDNSVKEIEKFPTKWGKHSNSFENLNKLINYSTSIKEALYKPLKIFDIKMENMEEVEDIEDNMYKKIYSGMKTLYSFKFSAENANDVYLKINGNVVDKAKIYVNGKELCEYMELEKYSVVKIGKFNRNDVVNVDIEFIEADNIVINDVWVYYEDLVVYEKVMNELKKAQLDIKDMTASTLEGKIEINKDNQLILFTIPYDKYLKIYIDGIPVDSMCVLDSLLAAPISKGTHIIKVAYEPTYLVHIISVSIIAIVLAGIFIGLEYKVKNKKSTLSE